MKYTVSMATWYSDQWHLDLATESAQMSKMEAITAGHELAEMGACPMYTEYVNGKPGRVMVEFYGHLEPAFAEMVAPRVQSVKQKLAA